MTYKDIKGLIRMKNEERKYQGKKDRKEAGKQEINYHFELTPPAFMDSAAHDAECSDVWPVCFANDMMTSRRGEKGSMYIGLSENEFSTAENEQIHWPKGRFDSASPHL